MHLRSLALTIALTAAPLAAQSSNTLYIGDNVMTGRTWHAATNAGTGASGSCSTTSGIVNYFSAPFFTDTTASTYELHLYYPSFQSGFVYLYQDAFDPLDPCENIIEFGYAPLADIYNISLDANRQYFFVTSEDVLFGGGGWFQVTIEGPAGSQIVEGNAPPSGPVAYCFGDGSGAACPCGNTGSALHGCGNSTNAAGAQLAASGSTSVGSDTFTLSGSGMPNGIALYFQGTQAFNTGVAFGDGLRCVGGMTIRLGTKANSSGSSSYPASGDAAISIRGAVNAGDVRFYQCWYRDSVSFCQPATFNFTNAVRVTWTP